MAVYKRNQIEEAISRVVDPTAKTPSAEVLTRLKRLLDTDRNLGRNPRSADPEQATYAFYSGEASGSGVEVWFQEYEAFALLTALRCLDHGFPQQRTVVVLRGVRDQLAQEHARILRMDRKTLFDQEAVMRAAKPGQIAVSSTAPVFLVISSERGVGSKATQDRPLISLRICQGEAEMMGAVKASFGPKTIMEIGHSAWLLHDALSQTEPSQRGRAAT